MRMKQRRAQMIWKLFRPTAKASNFIAVNAGSQSIKLTDDTGDISIAVVNLGTAPAWISFGGSSVTANMTQDIPVAAGSTRGFTAQAPAGGSLYVAAIAAGATGNIWFTPGVGN